MPRTFDGTDDQIYTDVVTETNITFGAFASILRCTSFAATRAWMRFVSAGFTNQGGVFFNTSGQVGYSNTASAPVGTTSLLVNEWYCVVGSKTTGTTTPRVHIYRYSNNTWVHENTGAAISNMPAVGISGFLSHGGRVADQFMPGEIAIDAIWGRDLSDAECELLPFSLRNWISLVPAGLWIYDQADIAQPVSDLTGGGSNQISVIGTTVSTTSVPLFTYSGNPWLVIRPQSGGPNLYDRTVIGSIPSQSASLVKLLAASRSVTGSKLSDSGILTRLYLAIRSVEGSISTSTGILTRLINISKLLVGILPASTSNIVRILLAIRSLSGSKPDSSGILNKTLLALRNITGFYPESNGLISRSYIGSRILSGIMISSSGIVEATTDILRSLFGTIPDFSGVIIRNNGVFTRNVAGILLAYSATLSKFLVAFRSINGTISFSSAILSFSSSFSRNLIGTLPNLNGILTRSVQVSISISGALPSFSSLMGYFKQIFVRSSIRATGIITIDNATGDVTLNERAVARVTLDNE